ncbi:Vacuolar cation/proton exchanger 2 [Penicillium rolfsii]|nr:Vacuolar cation/proton exchanger 2 [Penicillium rolfsii]
MCWVTFKSICTASMVVNILWPFVPAAIAIHFARPDLHVWVFALNYIAMVPSANVLGFAGGELAKKLPKVLGILLETFLGAVVEIVLFMVLLHNDHDGHLLPVIQAAILGSILANLLLCLGTCFFVGGLRRSEQVFHEAVSEVGTGLLLVAGFGLLIPSAFFSALKGAVNEEFTIEMLSDYALKISRATAVILLIAFVTYLIFNLHSHNSIFDEILEKDEAQDEDRHIELRRAKLTFAECILAIVISLACVCMSAVFLVQEIEHIVDLGVSDNFMGLILVPLVEKAAEHLTAVDEAWDNQINFALFHCLGPSIQTALLNAPLAVLVGWGLNKDMSLNFEIFMVVLLVLSILVVGNFLRDGKSNYLEGTLIHLPLVDTTHPIAGARTCRIPRRGPASINNPPIMQTDTLTDQILATFKERDLSAKRDVIESALTDPATEEWVSKHLNTSTLLSREELALYNKLEASGALQPILRDPELGATRPFLEDDIQSAIEFLQASTATIQKRTETLAFQCDTLKKQLRQQEKWEQDQSRDIARLRKKHQARRQSTTIAANELSDELEASFRKATEKTSVENKRILSSLSSRLKQDDKVLTDLEALVSGIKSHSNDADTVQRASQLSGILADYNAEEIHYRLDRLYLETIHLGITQSGPSKSNHIDTESDTIAALEEELESLYPEIEILAEMSTKQQFHEPILREIHNKHSQLRATSSEKLERALDILTDMTESTKSLTQHFSQQESSYEVLEQLATLYQNEVGTTPLVTQPPLRRESLRRRSIQPGLLLTAPRSNSTPQPDQPELESLLRRVGVSAESVIRPQAEDGGAQRLHEKRIQLSETLRALGMAVDTPLVTQLAPADRALYLLSSALHANSDYAISLQDPEAERALSGLEGELEELQRGVQGLDMDVLHQRDQMRDRFLQRWG